MRFLIAPGRTLLLLASLATLAGCATANGPIIPTGQPGQYTLTSRSGDFSTSWVELKRQAIDRAKDFCASQGLKLTNPDVSSNHATGFTRAVTYVTFNCDTIPQPSKDQGQNQQ
ncbi:hypothetical protein ACL598_08895 [Bordetella bronchialis]|uniref:hypothetical protein n=1 Tax=Bordetella bronchialis TaxID=463025 RepID=UPI003CFCA871